MLTDEIRLWLDLLSSLFAFVFLAAGIVARLRGEKLEAIWLVIWALVMMK